jgi:2-polyprenyl-3-methyl-5-hydroxy-6-metoxy-1,4-benzoquinol methylase
MTNYKLYVLTNKCKLSSAILDDAEIIVEFDSLPIPGLFFSSKNEAMDKKVPMTLVRSKEGLIQLKETINSNLYHYYKSGALDANHEEWLNGITNQIKSKFNSNDKILEIGGGKGFLMEKLFKNGFKHLYNIDPSHENEVKTIFKAINGFFPESLDMNFYKNYFSCIIGQHFLEHVEDPLKVMKGVKDVLSENGELWIEVPDIESSALASDYQTSIIYPLHLSYFTKKSLKELGEKAGLFLEDITIIQHYGNSIWAKFTKKSNKINSFNLEEDKRLIPTIRKYFEDLKTFTSIIPNEVICWGAAERAHITLGIMNSYGIKVISIFDSNPEIKGMFISGFDTPVLGPESFPNNPKDLLVLSPRHHISIVDSIKNKLSKNTMIYIPFIGYYTFEKYEEEFFNK